MVILCRGLLRAGLLLKVCLGYDYGIYDCLMKYAFLSKISYCIDQLKEDHDLSTPIVLKPKAFSFLQSGYDQKDYYSLQAVENNLELHIAKFLYPEISNTETETSSVASSKKDDNSTHRSEGFFALDHSTENGTIILTLRGSVHWRDFLTDFDINTIKYIPLSHDAKMNFQNCHNCKVHKGFYRRFKELHGEIFSTIETLVDSFPNYSLVITGHSMGGSIAILTGLELALMGYKPLIIAYGSPKVSNRELSRFMDDIFFTEGLVEHDVMNDQTLTEGCVRVVHKGDYVPLLPPGKSKFVQSGFEFYIDKDDLPHPKSSVKFNGLSHQINHSFDLNFWDLFSFDLSKILHRKEHDQYFYNLDTCNDVRSEMNAFQDSEKKLASKKVMETDEDETEEEEEEEDDDSAGEEYDNDEDYESEDEDDNEDDEIFDHLDTE